MINLWKDTELEKIGNKWYPLVLDEIEQLKKYPEQSDEVLAHNIVCRILFNDILDGIKQKRFFIPLCCTRYYLHDPISFFRAYMVAVAFNRLSALHTRQNKLCIVVYGD
jgi:hypothetical protein